MFTKFLLLINLCYLFAPLILREHFTIFFFQDGTSSDYEQNIPSFILVGYKLMRVINSPLSMTYTFCGECPDNQNTVRTLVEIQACLITKCEHFCFVLCLSYQDFCKTGVN